MERIGRTPLAGPVGTPDTEVTRRYDFRAEGADTAGGGAVQRSRAFSRRVLESWRWLPAVDEKRRLAVEDVLLMISELVTNACLYAPGGPRELRLRWNGDRLRVEVADDGSERPQLRPDLGRGRPGGYGLRVVLRLARAWGSQPEDGGKTVWLEVPSPLARVNHRGPSPSEPTSRDPG
ncbi:ATP-binding protein [Kitasatospora sp. NPDC093550]|uniref:ATP-binding protein n=1 Tax=Kitasatospora sp. NPDC093550 TaxID=3364089 RepID=UPI003812D26B